MVGVSDDAEQTLSAPIPSPKMFGRPAAPAGHPDQGSADENSADQDSGDETSVTPASTATEPAASTAPPSRFPSTGDARVDQAVAHLPDPDEHRPNTRHDEAAYSTGSHGHGSVPTTAGADPNADPGALETEGPAEGSAEAPSDVSLPDPGLLDTHIADVTSVHRQLQQRLSDLSG
ncbi:hypothetical protein GCM10011492_24090 [Flexivirga endophytica]|uniref:Uncharacterized protein n=1 Tax=Flexivirga endophytica TaxID=1849103 RepID=A0A916WUX3_9MICO|nr:hypothetical protein GCM10011492_24090 [Flexivirga endophytica]GHB40692.1 hypothetical protein GCM10008112_06480 [Flexivirga endophytica]